MPTVIKNRLTMMGIGKVKPFFKVDQYLSFWEEPYQHQTSRPLLNVKVHPHYIEFDTEREVPFEEAYRLSKAFPKETVILDFWTEYEPSYPASQVSFIGGMLVTACLLKTKFIDARFEFDKWLISRQRET